MRKLLLVSVLLSVVLYSCKSQQEKAEELYSQALAADSLKNFKESITLYEKAGLLGKAEAYWHLGDIYRDTIAGVTDTIKAVAYYHKADSLGVLEASSELGALYYRGFASLKSDTTKAIKLIQKAGDKATGNGNYTIALYYYGTDNNKCQEYAEKAVKQGQPRAYGCLSRVYSEKKDYKKALELLKKGVELKVPECMYIYGVILADSQISAEYGIEPDGKLAASLLKSVVNDYPDVAVTIGYLYSYGYGVEKDQVKAAYWFRIAANANDPVGMYDYGVSLLNGYGVNKDTKAAKEWFKKSAQLGYEEAKKILNQYWLFR